MPPIYQALRVTSEGFNVPTPIDVILEVQQHLGEGRVRCVAMQPTDGMVRGMKAIDLGGPISVPVGHANAGPGDERHRRTGGRARPHRREAAPSHPSPGARPSTSSPPRRRCSRPASRSSI